MPFAVAHRDNEMGIDKAHQLPSGNFLFCRIKKNRLDNKKSESGKIFKFWSLASAHRIFYGEWVKIKFSNHHIEFGLCWFSHPQPNKSSVAPSNINEVGNITGAINSYPILIKRNVNNHGWNLACARDGEVKFLLLFKYL